MKRKYNNIRRKVLGFNERFSYTFGYYSKKGRVNTTGNVITNLLLDKRTRADRHRATRTLGWCGHGGSRRANICSADGWSKATAGMSEWHGVYAKILHIDSKIWVRIGGEGYQRKRKQKTKKPPNSKGGPNHHASWPRRPCQRSTIIIYSQPQTSQISPTTHRSRQLSLPIIQLTRKILKSNRILRTRCAHPLGHRSSASKRRLLYFK